MFHLLQKNIFFTFCFFIIKRSKTKNIAVISTKFTAESHGYKNKAKMIDTELNVKEIACVEFPMMIETGWDDF